MKSDEKLIRKLKLDLHLKDIEIQQLKYKLKHSGKENNKRFRYKTPK